MKQSRFDIAIVGAGLAGITLSYFLKKIYGKTVLVIDEPQLSISSKVAAGIYNPIIFKRTTLTWNAETILNSCRKFYEQASRECGVDFHHSCQIKRVLSGFEEQNEWVRKSGMERFKPFISDAIEQTDVFPFGLATVHFAGWVDTSLFINTVLKNIVSTENYLMEKFEYDKLTINENDFEYKNTSFDQLVFCEGHLIKNNPWFNFIPMYPVKGDVLELELNDLTSKNVFNGGAYLVPTNNQTYKLGSTYDWENLNDVPDDKSKSELLEKLNSFYKGKINLIQHSAGVRPATKDRKPVVGQHPKHKNMFVLNGLGTKGVSLAPWTSAELSELMVIQKQINEEITIQRFCK